MKNENEVCSLEKIKKVHIKPNNKSEENLLHTFKQANLLTDEVRKHIKNVFETRTVCQNIRILTEDQKLLCQKLLISIRLLH